MAIDRVKFVGSRGDVLSVVEIDAPLGRGGHDGSWHTIFGVRAHITASEFRVEGNRLVQRVHLGEFDPAATAAPFRRRPVVRTPRREDAPS